MSRTHIEKILLKKLYLMRKRCENPGDKNYRLYGAVGINVCDEWKKDKMAFVHWAMKNGFKQGLTIERINNKLGYEPSNCKFIPMSEQPKNTSRNVFIEYSGEPLIISEVARREGVSCEAIRKRLKRGWYRKVQNPNQEQQG